MSSSTLSTVRNVADEIFGLGQSAGWAIPEVGEAVAAFSAVGEALVDLLIPNDAPPPPTRQDLQNAITEINAHIDQAFFQNDQRGMRTDLKTMSDGLRGYLADALNPQSISAAYQGPLSKHDRAKIWDTKFNALIAPLNDLNSPIRHIPNYVTTEPTYRFQTLPIYIAGCNLWFHCNRIAILWELNTAMRDHKAAVVQFNTDLQQFRQAMNVWKANQPNGGPKPKFKGKKPSDVFGTAAIGHTSMYADNIRKYIDGYIAYVERVLGEIEAEYAQAYTHIKNYDGTTMKLPTPDGSVIMDATMFGIVTASVPDDDVAVVHRDVLVGVARASVVADLQSRDASFVTARDVVAMRKTLASWKQLRSDVTDPTKDLTKELGST